MTIGQNQKARVIDDQRQAAAALFGCPGNELFSVTQIEGAGTEGDQGQPLSAVGGDVAKVLPNQRGRLKVMMLDDQTIEALDIGIFGQQSDLKVIGAPVRKISPLSFFRSGREILRTAVWSRAVRVRLPDGIARRR